jgi:hypothetical protein
LRPSCRCRPRRATSGQGSCRRRSSGEAQELPANRVNVAIAVTEEARQRIYEIAAACRALGLEHRSTLADIGVLMGAVEPGNLRRLWAVPGIVAIELECKLRSRQLSALAVCTD